MSTLANLVAIFHGVVAVYFFSLVFIISRKYKKNTKWYVIPAIPMFLIQWFYLLTQGDCPLTILENHLRSQANLSQYQTGFICHYSEKLFGFTIPDRIALFAIGVITMVFIIKFVILPHLRKNPSSS